MVSYVWRNTWSNHARKISVAQLLVTWPQLEKARLGFCKLPDCESLFCFESGSSCWLASPLLEGLVYERKGVSFLGAGKVGCCSVRFHTVALWARREGSLEAPPHSLSLLPGSVAHSV